MGARWKQMAAERLDLPHCYAIGSRICLAAILLAKRDDTPRAITEVPPAGARLTRFRSKSRRAFLSGGGAAIVLGLAGGSLAPAGVLNLATAYGMLVLAWVLGTIIIGVSEWIWTFPVRHRPTSFACDSWRFGRNVIWCRLLRVPKEL